MLITLMFSVVTKTSRAFSSLPCPADEEEGSSWEGAEPGREPRWPVEIFHTMGVALGLGVWAGRGAGIFSFPEFQLSPLFLGVRAFQ